MGAEYEDGCYGNLLEGVDCIAMFVWECDMRDTLDMRKILYVNCFFSWNSNSTFYDRECEDNGNITKYILIALCLELLIMIFLIAESAHFFKSWSPIWILELLEETATYFSTLCWDVHLLLK